MKSTQTGEGIVDRLNGALSTMRRERDELHRQKDLAFERLKLVREERVAVEKVVQSMRKELEKLSIETSDEGRKSENESIETLIKDVNRLYNEASFQHQELVSKKELLNQLENRISQDQSARDIQLQKTMADLRRQREKTIDDLKQDSCESLDDTQRIDAFRRVFKNLCNDDTFQEKIPRFIQMKIAEIGKKSVGLKRCESLQKKINGYNQLLGEWESKTKDTMEQ